MVPIHQGDVAALLTLLGESGEEATYSVGVVEVTPEQMRLSGTPVLPLGSPVKIFQDPQLWLGEVIECSPESTLVVKLIHSLADVQELTRLAERFLGKARAPTPTLS